MYDGSTDVLYNIRTNSLFSVYTISENRNRGYYYEIKILQ